MKPNSRLMADSRIDSQVRKEVRGEEKVDDEGGVPLTSQCSVCTAPAAEHIHYGAVSCYSCRWISNTYPNVQCKTAQPSTITKICLPIYYFRAFFRRGAPKQKKCIFGHNECNINQHNRTNCKLCRYQRCLETGMRPDKVNKYLNRRKEREAMIARCGGLPGEQKKVESSQESTSYECARRSIDTSQQYSKQATSAYSKHEETHMILGHNSQVNPAVYNPMGCHPRPTAGWAYRCPSESPLQEEVTWQSEVCGPLDMRMNQSVIIARNDMSPTSSLQPVLSPKDDKIILDLSLKSQNHTGLVYPATIKDVSKSPSPDSSTTFSCSSVIRFAPSSQSRREVVMLRKEEDEQNKEAAEKGLRDNPLLPFTLEEEFKVIDVIVRMQDYIAKRFIFVQQNFGDDVFPNYSKLATEKTVCTNTSGKLSRRPNSSTSLWRSLNQTSTTSLMKWNISVQMSKWTCWRPASLLPTSSSTPS